MNVLRQALAWLGAQQKTFASEAIAYTRGANTVALMAVVGATPFRQTEGNGRSVMKWSEADFVIFVAELILGAVVVEPVGGDKIVWNGDTYMVSAPGGEQVARKIDMGLRWRVHAKAVG